MKAVAHGGQRRKSGGGHGGVPGAAHTQRGALGQLGAHQGRLAAMCHRRFDDPHLRKSQVDYLHVVEAQRTGVVLVEGGRGVVDESHMYGLSGVGPQASTAYVPSNLGGVEHCVESVEGVVLRIVGVVACGGQHIVSHGGVAALGGGLPFEHQAVVGPGGHHDGTRHYAGVDGRVVPVGAPCA